MKISRRVLTLAAVVLVGASLTYALWPRPVDVDMGVVDRRPMRIVIAEEGRTRVHDTYVVATPVAGRLLRVGVEPGDEVIAGESLIAQMEPSLPTPLDVRDRSQARADVSAAKAALELVRTERDRAIADKRLADVQLRRMENLLAAGGISQSQLDHAVREADRASAALRNAEAAINVKRAELTGARSRLVEVEAMASGGQQRAMSFPIVAPATGLVLRVVQESEATLPAGTAIMEIGDVEGDLEVLVELLSSEAIRVSRGDRALFTDWGGHETLEGVVERIEPWGFTKVSALGVEEQRVKTILRFTDPPEALRRLGHGFRVDVQIVIWEDLEALVVPSSALFRQGPDWAVFVVTEGTARLRKVAIARNNGVEAQVTEGLDVGDQVVLYPSSELTDGARVSRREVR